MNSREEQQGEPEICRESVTITMVQEVYGSQPQIRAGIGPTEPVRPMSEQELAKRLVDRVVARFRLFRDNVENYVDLDLLPIIRDYVRQQSAPDALLELAIHMGAEAEHGLIPRPTPADARKQFEEGYKS